MADPINQGQGQGQSFLDWLIPSQVRRDIASLMRKPYSAEDEQGKMLSKSQFVDQYWIKGFNPATGRSRHYIDSTGDFQYDSDYVNVPTHTTEGGSALGANREKTGWKFHGSEGRTKTDAYNLYKQQYNAIKAENEAFDIDPYDVDFMDPTSILSNLEGIGKDYQKGAISIDDPAKTVRALNPKQFRGLHSSFYTPYVEAARNPFERVLTGNRATSRAAGGDFAGYGRRGLLEEASEGSFLEGIEGIYGQVDEAKAGALSDIYSQLSGWEDLTE